MKNIPLFCHIIKGVKQGEDRNWRHLVFPADQASYLYLLTEVEAASEMVCSNKYKMVENI
jgi:hypothetical protein